MAKRRASANIQWGVDTTRTSTRSSALQIAWPVGRMRCSRIALGGSHREGSRGWGGDEFEINLSRPSTSLMSIIDDSTSLDDDERHLYRSAGTTSRSINSSINDEIFAFHRGKTPAPNLTSPDRSRWCERAPGLFCSSLLLFLSFSLIDFVYFLCDH